MMKQKNMGRSTYSAGTYEATVSRVSTVSVVGNLLLSVFKLLAGIIGKSSAMLSDAVHSLSDVLGSLIVIIGVLVSGKAADEEHPYGHERFECVASILLSGLLLFAGIEIIKTGIGGLWSRSYETASAPGILALAAAVVSILVKEGMFWYTMGYARQLNSGSLRAEAWHHRSDSLSSVGSLIGILGARLGIKVLDPAAAVLISIFILKAAVDIFRDAIDRLTDHACDHGLEASIRSCVQECGNIRSIDLLRTREFGRKIYVDLEVSMDKNLVLEQAHEAAEQIHDAIEKRFPEVKHVMVHVNPFSPD